MTFSRATAHIIETTAYDIGFECCGYTSTTEIDVNPKVRDMCAADRCKAYNKNWMCPPACGTLETFEAIIAKYSLCVVVQTVSILEDEFDFEGMAEAEQVHKDRFEALVQTARSTLASNSKSYTIKQEDLFPLSAGSCSVCPSCSYPEEPCRNPSKAFVSMEAAGLLVSDVCEAASIPYFHGKGTLAYTSCLLI